MSRYQILLTLPNQKAIYTTKVFDELFSKKSMGDYFQNTYAYSKKRRDFGKQPLFTMVPGHMLDSINPDKEEQRLYILRNPVNNSAQATLPLSEHDANSEQVILVDQGINHSEGGWPREVHTQNEEQVLRHRRRVMHDDSYINAVLNLSPHMRHYLDQNNAIDMYQAYFAGMRQQAPVETYQVRQENTFRDPLNRPVSSISWSNEKQSKIAVSYSHREWTSNSKKPNTKLNACYLWDVNRQTAPEHEIFPEFPCGQLVCSPTDPLVLVAGLDSGTVNVFDIRDGKTAVSSSSIFNSHAGPITALLYCHSRTNTEFFTGSIDGCCYWWDTRNLSGPLDHLIMSVKLSHGEKPALSNAEGVSSLDFNSGLPTKFLCGTDTGLVINVNRMGREHSEVMASYWQAHSGAVRAVHRSRCTMRMFATCGEYSVHVWSEEVRTAPIIITRPYRYQVTDFAWTPLRYSSYMVVCQGGYFYYWDFLRKYKDPVAYKKISDYALTKVTPHEDGYSVAVGDSNGSTYLLQLSDNMAIPGGNDKQLMNLVYERESKREHLIDARVRELHLKQRIQEETQEREDKLSNIEAVDAEKTIELAVEEEYFKIVNEELRKMEDTSRNSALSFM